MRLISKFHDYYDTPFQQSAADPKFHFIRDTKTITMNIPHYRHHLCGFNGDRILGGDPTVSNGLIGFCGHLYPFIKVHYPAPYRDKYFYSYEDFVKSNENYLQKDQPNKKVYAFYNFNIEKWLQTGALPSYKQTYDAINDQNILNIFEKYKVAYFVVVEKQLHPSKLNLIDVELYPCLKDYSFFKVFPTYEAFQQIEMYLTNNLVIPDKIELKISDKLKAESKGFDKWSFRKMSDKKE